MRLDEGAAIETVVSFLNLSENYVRTVPVWTFLQLLKRAEDRAAKQKSNS